MGRDAGIAGLFWPSHLVLTILMYLGELLSSLTEELRVLLLLPLVKDGDLAATIHSMLGLRGEGTVKVSKVKGHADQAMVDEGDRIGNDGADMAANLGRMRHKDEVTTARRALIRVRSQWYPVMLDLHQFMVAISRIEVNDDGHGCT